MRVLMKAVEMIAWFTENGDLHPVRFRIRSEDDSYTIIKINRIIEQHEEKLAGNRMITFTCQSIIHNLERNFELKYELNTCKWFLYKI